MNQITISQEPFNSEETTASLESSLMRSFVLEHSRLNALIILDMISVTKTEAVATEIFLGGVSALFFRPSFCSRS